MFRILIFGRLGMQPPPHPAPLSSYSSLPPVGVYDTSIVPPVPPPFYSYEPNNLSSASVSVSALGIPFPQRDVPLPGRNEFNPPSIYPSIPNEVPGGGPSRYSSLPPVPPHTLYPSYSQHDKSLPPTPSSPYEPIPPAYHSNQLPPVPQPPKQYTPTYTSQIPSMSHSQTLPGLPEAPKQYTAIPESHMIIPTQSLPVLPPHKHKELPPQPNTIKVYQEKERKAEGLQQSVSVIREGQKKRRKTVCYGKINETEESLPDDPRLVKVEDLNETIGELTFYTIPEHRIKFVNLPLPNVSPISFILPSNSGPNAKSVNNYESIIKTCMSLEKPFKDEIFPSAPIHGTCGESPVVWKRIVEVKPIGEFSAAGGPIPSDVVQGLGANIPFLVVASMLAGSKKLFAKVCPTLEWSSVDVASQEASLGVEGSFQPVASFRVNVFHFYFWKWGKWIEVIVDDRLPYIGNELAFGRCRNPNFFWLPLMEKAYAKLHGSYQAIEHCTMEDVILDLTGGSCERLDLNTDREAEVLWDTLMSCEKKKFPLFCCIESEELLTSQRILVRPNGLLLGRPYEITAVKELDLSKKGNLPQKHRLVRLQSIWEGFPWKGAWCAHSPEMRFFTEKQKKKHGITCGRLECWMKLSDVMEQFDMMYMAKPLFLLKKKPYVMFNSWNSSGGCPKYATWMKRNPQLVVAAQDDDTIHVSLLQQDWKIFSRETQKPLHHIGFVVFKVEENRDVRIHRVSHPMAVSDYSNKREASVSIRVRRGKYLILPSPFKAKQSLPFLLRVWTESRSCQAKLLSREKPKKGFLKSRQKGVLTIEIVKAKGLMKAGVLSCDPFAEVCIEGTTKKTKPVKDTQDPEWRQRFIFFLRKPQKAQAKITIWHDGVVSCSFLGVVTLNINELLGKVNGVTYRCSVPLELRKKDEKAGREISGFVVVRLNYFGNIKAC